MIDKDYIAALILFIISTSLGLFLVLYNPTLFTYVLGSLLIISGSLIIILKHVFMCVDRPRPLDVV
jgi:hypothetical protein